MKVKSIELLYGEKTWIQVIFDNGTVWIPSFDEVGKIINLIGKCEDEKYPRGKGLDLVREFIEETILTGISYEEFCKIKKIPMNYKIWNRNKSSDKTAITK